MSENERAFIDSNVLVYTQSSDDPVKRAKAQQAIDHCKEACISTQVMSEIANVLIRKKNIPLERVRALTLTLAEVFTVKTIDISCIMRTFKLLERYHLSYYDSLIVASALEAECTILYSEDMSDGLLVDGKLRIVNPFNCLT
ncbi:MAG: PIN domain-containing protein [Coriobacteriia bacterium]|nr:PIN domain-containing protein [Coriobacteriia bacterium]